MTYQRHNWQNGRDGGTPITAEALNEIEDGIEEALDFDLGIGTVSAGGIATASITGAPGEKRLNLTLPTNTNFGYLVANFANNDTDYEKLSLHYSPDGKYVAPGIHNPVYAPAQGVRDPHVMKHNGKWYVAYTINNGANKTLGVASSPDLVNWSTVATPSVAAATGISRAWAPEFVKDYDGSVYMFFTNNDETSGRLTTWRVKARDVNLSSWGAPEKVVWATEPPSLVIDPTFLRYEGGWLIFFGSGGTINRARAESLTGPWTIERMGDWAGWKAAAEPGVDYEGPSIVQTGESSWRLYMDRYKAVGNGHEFPGYCYTDTTDLETWTTPVTVTRGLGLPREHTLRHGTFLKLETAEDQALAMAATGLGRPVVPHVEMSAPVNATSPGQLMEVPFTVDEGRSQRWTDAAAPHGNSTIRIRESGVYTLSMVISGSANFGGGWMAIKSPDQTVVYATNDMMNGAPAWSVTAPNVFLNHGELVKFFHAPSGKQSAGLSTVRVRVTKVG